MDWFNIYGLIFVATLLVPNIVYGALHRDVQPPKCGKVLEICEQIGRYGAMACMVFNIPYVVFGFWFAGGFAAYLFAGGALLFLYILLFITIYNWITSDISYLPAGFQARNFAASTAPFPNTALEYAVCLNSITSS